MASRLKRTKNDIWLFNQPVLPHPQTSELQCNILGWTSKALTTDATIELYSELRLDDAGPSCRDDADVSRRDRQGVAGVTTVECLRHTFSISL